MISTVSIVQDPDIGQAINSCLNHLEDLSDIFSNQKIAVKVNETWASARDKSACTQPESLRAAIRFIKVFRPASITVLGGSGADTTSAVFRHTGLDRVIGEENAAFLDLNQKPCIPVWLEPGPLSQVMINPGVFEYDTLVSLAQLKVHRDTDVTLSMKNMAMSYPSAGYYGYPREMIHQNTSKEDLHDFISSMCTRFPIYLSIIVAHPAMTGTGPIGGKVSYPGLVITSRDFVAADRVGAMILGLDQVRHIQGAAELGLGRANLEQIEIKGISIEEARSRQLD